MTFPWVLYGASHRRKRGKSVRRTDNTSKTKAGAQENRSWWQRDVEKEQVGVAPEALDVKIRRASSCSIPTSRMRPSRRP